MYISLDACRDYILWSCVFFFNDTPTTELYTLSLHDALPILPYLIAARLSATTDRPAMPNAMVRRMSRSRSEEHTSELQSRENLVCRLLLEKKKSYTMWYISQTFLAARARKSRTDRAARNATC